MENNQEVLPKAMEFSRELKKICDKYQSQLDGPDFIHMLASTFIIYCCSYERRKELFTASLHIFPDMFKTACEQMDKEMDKQND